MPIIAHKRDLQTDSRAATILAGYNRHHNLTDLNPLQSRDLEPKGRKQDGFPRGKRVLITGLLSNRSIAYGVAQAARREGADLAFTYQNERFKDRVTEMAENSEAHWSSLVTSRATPRSLRSSPSWPGSGLHSTAWCTRSPLRRARRSRRFPRRLVAGGVSASRHDVSSYSFAALAKAALPLMQGRSGALVTLTYLGAIEWFRATTPWASPRRASRPACAIWLRASDQKAFASTPSRPGRSRLSRERDIGIQQDPQVRRGEFSAAAKRHDRGRG